MPPISIHALLAESDSKDPCIHTSCWNFYPRSPCGERPYLNCFVQKHTEKISIHALLAESDHYDNYNLHCVEISIHALLAESDKRSFFKRLFGIHISIHALLAESDVAPVLAVGRARYFYPRSPCGERRDVIAEMTEAQSISIHALLAESDRLFNSFAPSENMISIHALLAESDLAGPSGPAFLYNFYPRSPCGERHFSFYANYRHLAFLSTLSLRRATKNTSIAGRITSFLSTLSLRRATYWPCVHVVGRSISIHALLAESDVRGEHHANSQQEFLSTLSLRRATLLSTRNIHSSDISIHALLAESDADTLTDDVSTGGFLSTLSLRRATLDELCRMMGIKHFYPRSPCGERPDEPSGEEPEKDFYPRSPCGERPCTTTIIISTA